MSNSVVLDTSVIIEFLRSKDKKSTILYKLSKSQVVFYASLITHTELYAGKSVWEKPKAKRELAIIFKGINLVSFDEDVSENAGRIRAKYNVDLLDAIIAATSIVKKIPLLTTNLKHFSRIPKLRLYGMNVLS